MKKSDMPNILASRDAIFVQLKCCKHWVPCRLLRVYYQDVHSQRHLWVDVEVLDVEQTQGQKQFLRIPLHHLHRKYHALATELSFRQEESDVAHTVRLKSLYTALLDIRLKQSYNSIEGYAWQGMLTVCRRPVNGNVYGSGVSEPLVYTSFVHVTPMVPLVYSVKDKGKTQAASQVTIFMCEQQPVVLVEGDILSVMVHIGGRLYSGRETGVKVYGPGTLKKTVRKRVQR